MMTALVTLEVGVEPIVVAVVGLVVGIVVELLVMSKLFLVVDILEALFTEDN